MIIVVIFPLLIVFFKSMILTREQLDEFKELYKKNFGKDITDAEASEQGNKLIDLIKIMYKK